MMMGNKIILFWFLVSPFGRGKIIWNGEVKKNHEKFSLVRGNTQMRNQYAIIIIFG